MSKYLKNVITVGCFIMLFPSIVFAQVVGLKKAIQISQEKSIDYQVAANNNKIAKWNYLNLRNSYLPKIFIGGTIPNYVNSINKVTLPNGEDTFVSQNQSFNSLDLSMKQNISFTGGTLSVGSFINRIDVFGANRSTRYSIVPASISYVQNGFRYNEFKWQRQLEPLRLEIANRDFVANMEKIALQTVYYYYDALEKQLRLELTRQNLSNTISLYNVYQERHKLGTVSKSELLQLDLRGITLKSKMLQDSVDLLLANQRLKRYLALEQDTEIELENSGDVEFFNVQNEQAIAMARKNNSKLKSLELLKLEARRNIAKIESDNALKFSLSTNFGVSNSSTRFYNLFDAVQNQQHVTLTFSMPIIDWGMGRLLQKRAQANLDLIQNKNEQDEISFEQEISQYISKWSLMGAFIKNASAVKKISENNFILELERYKSGSITLNDLNIAQEKKDSSNIEYLLALKNYWETFYLIRAITLYDYSSKQNIVYRTP